MSSSKSATVSKRSATTTPTVGPSKSSKSASSKPDVSNKPCKLCAQDTVLAAPSVKRKGDPFYNATVSTSTPGTSDGRKIGENKLLSKTNKNTRFSPYGGMCEGCGGRTNRAGAKYCHTCAYQKGCCVHGKKILDTSGYKQTNK